MQLFIKLLILSFLYPFVNGYGQTIINVKKDFNAKGDGKTDDTQAIQAAVAKVNGLKQNVVLIIPKGIYLIKPQRATVPNAPAPFESVNILSFVNCSGITIKGEKGTKVLFSGPLYYGAFKRTAKGFEKFGVKTTSYQHRVAIGHGINLENCKDVTIETLEIDGNNRDFILGSEFGDVGMQIDNDGIFINNSINVTLSNLNIHHFGRDGIQIINKTPQAFNTPSQKLQMINCSFEYNGRQGFSWTGGVGLTATNCFFNYTGKSKFGSPPGAGIDFEPNGGYIVKDGKFTNCTIKSNNGIAVLADEGGFNARDVQFTNCTLQGEQSAAVWIKSPSFQFINCKINGGFYFGCPATNPQEGTKFIDCLFTDQFSTSANNNFLIESNGAKYLSFVNCTFKARAKGLIYVAAGSTNIAERAVFKDCKFMVPSARASTQPTIGSFTTGVDYTGRTTFMDSSNTRTSWNIENSRFIGTDNIKNDINIQADHILASYDKVIIGDDKDDVKVNILQDAALLINNNARLLINDDGELIIKKGGALWIAPGAELIINGKLTAEEGAFLCIHNQAKISGTSIKNIKIGGKVNFADPQKLNLGLSGCITVGK